MKFEDFQELRAKTLRGFRTVFSVLANLRSRVVLSCFEPSP